MSCVKNSYSSGHGTTMKIIPWQEFYQIEEKMDYELSEKITKLLLDLSVAVGIPPGAELLNNGNGGYNNGKMHIYNNNNENTEHQKIHKYNSQNVKNGNLKMGGQNRMNYSNHKHSDKKDLDWDTLRKDIVFKPTVLENKEGYEKIINEIRICLNKLTDKNYVKQRDEIFEHIRGILLLDDDLSREGFKRVANALFDIASTNKFFSKIYAQIYSELMIEFSIFGEIVCEFLGQFVDKIINIHYVDPDKDYDGYCLYVKSQDSRRAISGFMIHLALLMNHNNLEKNGFGKEELWKEIKRILMELSMKLELYIGEIGKLNEVEEIVEILFLLSTAGGKTLVVGIILGDEIKQIWRNLSTKKVKENPSWSSRAMFKIGDLVKLLK